MVDLTIPVYIVVLSSGTERGSGKRARSPIADLPTTPIAEEANLFLPSFKPWPQPLKDLIRFDGDAEIVQFPFRFYL